MTTPTEQNILKEIEDRIRTFENRDMDIIERYESDELYEEDEWEQLLNYKMNVAKLEGYQLAQKEETEELNIYFNYLRPIVQRTIFKTDDDATRMLELLERITKRLSKLEGKKDE